MLSSWLSHRNWCKCHCFTSGNLQHSTGRNIVMQSSIPVNNGTWGLHCEFSYQVSYSFLACPHTGIYAHFVTLDFTGREERQSERSLQPDIISNSWTKWRNYCCWLSHPSIFCKRRLPWRTLSRRKRLSLYLVIFKFLGIRGGICYK